MLFLPSFLFKSPFLTWIISTLLAYSLIFWAFHAGFLQHVFVTDFTHLSTIIAGLFIYLNLALGNMAYRLQQFIFDPPDDDTTSLFFTNFSVITYFSLTASVLGFLGTLIGLSAITQEAAHVTIENMSQLLGSGTGTALFPTMSGVFLTLVCGFQRFALEHSFRLNGFVAEL